MAKKFVYANWFIKDLEGLLADPDHNGFGEFHISCGANVLDADGNESLDEQWDGFFIEDDGAVMHIEMSTQTTVENGKKPVVENGYSVTLVCPAEPLLDGIKDNIARDGEAWDYWLSPSAPNDEEASDNYGVYEEGQLPSHNIIPNQVTYRDDFPDTTGPNWETAMDSLGHDVTSHLNETGPCSACGIK